jgi:hypothetical protein
MVTKTDIDNLMLTAENIIAMNDALQAAFLDTDNPTVSVTLPSGDTFVMPTYHALYAKYEQLKGIAVGLQTYGSDDYQLILNQTDGVLCQVSRFNPIIPTIAADTSVVDGFDIQTDKARKVLRLDFLTKLQTNSSMVLVNYITGSEVVTLARPILNTNLASNKVAEIAVSSGIETKAIWPFTLAVGTSLSVNDNVSIAGQLANVIAINGNDVTLNKDITAQQGSSIYKVYPNDNVYTVIPIRPCETISVRVIANNRTSNEIIIDAQASFYGSGAPYANILSGVTFDSAFIDAVTPIVLPVPDVSVPPNAQWTEPYLNFSERQDLMDDVNQLLADYALFQENCNNGLLTDIVSRWNNKLKPFAAMARDIIVRPFHIRVKHDTDIAKGYEIRYKHPNETAWEYQKHELPLPSQTTVSDMNPWAAFFKVRKTSTTIEYQARAIFMYAQPYEERASHWTATQVIQTNSFSEAMDNDYANFLRAYDIGQRYSYNQGLSAVAFSGQYNDLQGKPDLFSGRFQDLRGIPTLFNGDYNSLSNKPELFSGSWNDLQDKPDLVSLDDVIEATDYWSLPYPGASGALYVTVDNGNLYRWSGSAYVQIGSSGSAIPTLQQVMDAGGVWLHNNGYGLATKISMTEMYGFELSQLYSGSGSRIAGNNNELTLERTGGATFRSSAIFAQQHATFGQVNFGLYCGLRIVGGEGVYFEQGGTNTGVHVLVRNTNITASRSQDWTDANGRIPVLGAAAPATPTSNGKLGEIRVTSTHIYFCYSPNNWIRVAKDATTWP